MWQSSSSNSNTKSLSAKTSLFSATLRLEKLTNRRDREVFAEGIVKGFLNQCAANLLIPLYRTFRKMKQMRTRFSILFLALAFTACAQTKNEKKPSNMKNDPIPAGVKTETALFGEGCFWCTEAFFQRLEGVYKVESGYGGGFVVNPTYEQVCDKNTGHIELARIVYDPAKISYDELLEVFWKTHDPTTMDQQGNDVGPQYKSVIYYYNAEQKQKAESYKAKLDKSGAWDRPIVTEIASFKNFYPAEQYHQNYYNDNQGEGYCRFVIAPKLEKFEKVFKDKLKKN
jgi:peptide-methionine (S)-S-oxide reductase